MGFRTLRGLWRYASIQPYFSWLCGVIEMKDEQRWFVTIVLSIISSGGTYLATRTKGKSDVEASKTTVESVYIAEMRKIIEDYQQEREALKAEKEKLQALVEKVQKINRELEEDNRLLKQENRELREENQILKGGK